MFLQRLDQAVAVVLGKPEVARQARLVSILRPLQAARGSALHFAERGTLLRHVLVPVVVARLHAAQAVREQLRAIVLAYAEPGELRFGGAPQVGEREVLAPPRSTCVRAPRPRLAQPSRLIHGLERERARSCRSWCPSSRTDARSPSFPCGLGAGADDPLGAAGERQPVSRAGARACPSGRGCRTRRRRVLEPHAGDLLCAAARRARARAVTASAPVEIELEQLADEGAQVAAPRGGGWPGVPLAAPDSGEIASDWVVSARRTHKARSAPASDRAAIRR